MTRSKLFGQSTSQLRTANETDAANEPKAVLDPKLVDLVANGTHAFPASLSDGDAEQLREQVSSIRRSRLIGWIAHCLANRLLNEHQADWKEPTNE